MIATALSIAGALLLGGGLYVIVGPAWAAIVAGLTLLIVGPIFRELLAIAVAERDRGIH